jgi:hypothetical protein
VECNATGDNETFPQDGLILENELCFWYAKILFWLEQALRLIFTHNDKNSTKYDLYSQGFFVGPPSKSVILENDLLSVFQT